MNIMLVQTIVLSAALFLQTVHAQFPVVGRFTGSTQSGDLGSPVSGSEYVTEIEVDSEGSLRLYLPAFSCGSSWIKSDVFEKDSIEYVNVNSVGQCITEPTPITLTHIQGNEWEYRWESESLGQYGEAIMTYQCLNTCEEGFECNSLDNATLTRGDCLELNFASTDERNEYMNNKNVDCPFSNLAPADNNDDRGIVLEVYRDTSTFKRANANSYTETTKDDEATETIMRGQELVSSIEGCVSGLAGQRQGDQVCFTYEYSERGDDSSDECKSTCIDIGTTSSFEYYEFSTYLYFGGQSTSTIRNSDCRIRVSTMENSDNSSSDTTSDTTSVNSTPGSAPKTPSTPSSSSSPFVFHTRQVKTLYSSIGLMVVFWGGMGI